MILYLKRKQKSIEEIILFVLVDVQAPVTSQD